ncbi:hypothetical protein QOZ80_1BG0066920 [Eleusine coracana subsp. coracana]|nr:hypothetical protein QOZ80_1BG0066920 [Eleusine coracana subsp. coracana]
MITGVSKLGFVRLASSTSDTAKRTIALKDLSGYEMKLVLWGNCAVDFEADSVFNIGQEHHVVGAPSLSGSPACKWYLNEDIPDIEEFYDRLGEDMIKIEWISNDDVAGPSRGAATLEQKTVAELRALDPWVAEDTNFLCTVTVARLSPDQQWWFSCPKCHRAANPYGSEYRCTGSCGSVNAIPKYRLCLIASDGTSAAEFVLFGRVNAVETFFGRQACVPDVRVGDDMDDIDGSVKYKTDTKSTARKRVSQRSMPSVAKKNMHHKMLEPSKTVVGGTKDDARCFAVSE